MRVTTTFSNLTDRTCKITLKADTFQEERLLSLMREAVDKKGTIIVECGGLRLTWLPKDAVPG